MFSPDEIALAFTLLSLPTPAPTHFTLTLFNFSACRLILRHKYIRGHGGVAGAGLPCRPGSFGLLSFLRRMKFLLLTYLPLSTFFLGTVREVDADKALH